METHSRELFDEAADVIILKAAVDSPIISVTDPHRSRQFMVPEVFISLPRFGVLVGGHPSVLSCLAVPPTPIVKLLTEDYIL